jgi:HCOMODA/2-hydroxy-3-carboxy-muconic semialdehyde decarboxylase
VKPRKAAIADLVLANRILYQQGVLDAYGHVSVRDPEHPDRFLIARHMAPGIVTPDDIQTLDLEGNVLGGDKRKPYTEIYIHAAMFAAKPEVNGVVHTHSHSLIPFGATKTTLRPIWAPAAFLDEGTAHFDTRDGFGDTDLMIRTMPLGHALVEAIGERPVVLMRGHGGTVIGASVREAVFRAIYLEANAKIMLQSRLLGGEPIFMNHGESERSVAHLRADPSYRRAWEFWSSLVATD